MTEFIFKTNHENEENIKNEKRLTKEVEEIFAKHGISYKDCVFFIKNKHIGDIVRSLPAITIYRHYYPEDKNKRFVVLTRKNSAGLMEMNPDVNETIVFSPQELQLLEKYIEIKNKQIKIFGDGCSFYECYKLYDIPKEYVYYNRKLWKIPKSLGKESIKTAEKIINEMGLDPLKTVFIIPKAKASSSLDIQSLGPVVDIYKESGYRVLLNAFESEETLPGTEPINLPADIMLAMIQKGSVVLGVQCGIVDVCEWMELTNRIIKVYILKTDIDKKYYNNRKGIINKKIEKKDFGYTIAVSSEQDFKELNDMIIKVSKEIIG